MKKSYADMDPLEELRAIREEMSREFKTVGELCAYLRKKKAEEQQAGPQKSKLTAATPRSRKKSPLQVRG